MAKTTSPKQLKKNLELELHQIILKLFKSIDSAATAKVEAKIKEHGKKMVRQLFKKTKSTSEKSTKKTPVAKKSVAKKHVKRKKSVKK
jgi:hypothetical protein